MHNTTDFIAGLNLDSNNRMISTIISKGCLIAFACLAFSVGFSQASVAQNSTPKNSTVSRNATLPAEDSSQQPAEAEVTKTDPKQPASIQPQVRTEITLSPEQPVLISPFHIVRSSEAELAPDAIALLERHFIFSLKRSFEKNKIPVELLQIDQIADATATTSATDVQSKAKTQPKKSVYYDSQGKVIKEPLYAEENAQSSQSDAEETKEADKNAPALSSTTNQTIITLSGEIASVPQIPVRTITIKGKKRITAQAEITIHYTIYQESLGSEAFFIRNSVLGNSSINTASSQNEEQQSALQQKALLIALENAASTLVQKLTTPEKENLPKETIDPKDRVQYQTSPGKQLKKKK